MERWGWVAAAGVLAFFVWGWFHDTRSKKQLAEQMAKAQEHRTSEEYVIKQQMRFEDDLRKGAEIGLPDAIVWTDAHIYRYLMREWFAKLAAQSRYDEPKLKKLRKDWLAYMDLLEAEKRHNFLSRESEDEAKREKYGSEAWEERMQRTAIEDAFAQAIGAEAVAKLREIRAKDLLSFSKSGELAPEGYRYGLSSAGKPEELIPRNSN